MAEPVKIYEQQETFYVPQFVVKVSGDKLPDPVVYDILEVKYTDNVEEIDSFEITLNNWDAEKLRPKYEPPSTPEREKLFDPGEKVEVRMGYVGNLRLMLTGEITTLEPNFPASGGLTLSIRGLNLLHRFRTEQHTFAWENTSDSEIATELGQKPLKKGKPGLGVRVDATSVEEPEPFVFMDNQYDIVFLLARARRHGYEVVLKEVDKAGNPDPHIFFGPSTDKKDPPAPYLLEWGRSLLSFRPTLTTANQISEVVVRSWDRRKNRKIEGSATLKDCLPKGPERLRAEALAKAFGNRREIVTDRPVHTRKQAKVLAKDILCDKQKETVKASGATVGLPDLRAGRRVQIVNLGPRFDGEYYVTDTTHTIGDSGYRTEFKARREGAATAASQAGGGGG